MELKPCPVLREDAPTESTNKCGDCAYFDVDEVYSEDDY